jgi:predicted branched-subunit amino acid permease
VERFQLKGDAATAIRQLFTTPSEVRGAATVVGLVALLVWHRLVPSALLVAIGLAVLTAASVIYCPRRSSGRPRATA